MPTTPIASGEEMDQGQTHPGDATINGIFTRLDTLEALFPLGLGFSDWTPRLVVDDAHNADLGHGLWQPSNSTASINPTLGTGTYPGTTTPAGTSGRAFQVGKLLIATFNITFGATGTDPGKGAYRVSLPVPCGASPHANGTPIGFGHMFNVAVPNTFFGLGPGNFKHFMLHSPSAAITSDVAGLVLGTNVPAALLATYNVVQALTERTLVVPDPTLNPAIDSGSPVSYTAASAVTVNAGAGHQVNAFTSAAYVGRRITLIDGASTYHGVVTAVLAAGSAAAGGGSLQVSPPHGFSIDAVNAGTGAFIVTQEQQTSGGTYARGGALENTARVLASWIADMQQAFGTSNADNTAHSVPWAWGPSCRILGVMVYEAA